MWAPQAEQAKLSSRSHDAFRSLQPDRRSGYHRGTLDRSAARDRLHGGARAGRRHARRMRDSRPRHRDARDRRARSAALGGSHRRDSPRGRGGVGGGGAAGRGGGGGGGGGGAGVKGGVGTWAARGGDIVVGALVVLN